MSVASTEATYVTISGESSHLTDSDESMPANDPTSATKDVALSISSSFYFADPEEFPSTTNPASGTKSVAPSRSSSIYSRATIETRQTGHSTLHYTKRRYGLVLDSPTSAVPAIPEDKCASSAPRTTANIYNLENTTFASFSGIHDFDHAALLSTSTIPNLDFFMEYAALARDRNFRLFILERIAYTLEANITDLQVALGRKTILQTAKKCERPSLLTASQQEELRYLSTKLKAASQMDWDNVPNETRILIHLAVIVPARHNGIRPSYAMDLISTFADHGCDPTLRFHTQLALWKYSFSWIQRFRNRIRGMVPYKHVSLEWLEKWPKIAALKFYRLSGKMTKRIEITRRSRAQKLTLEAHAKVLKDVTTGNPYAQLILMNRVESLRQQLGIEALDDSQWESIIRDEYITLAERFENQVQKALGEEVSNWWVKETWNVEALWRKQNFEIFPFEGPMQAGSNDRDERQFRATGF